MDTIEAVEEYFNTCKGYWERKGDPPSVAFCKALWWDCVETFNFGKSWNPAKIEFVNQYRRYTPGGPIPEESRVESGNC